MHSMIIIIASLSSTLPLLVSISFGCNIVGIITATYKGGPKKFVESLPPNAPPRGYGPVYTQFG